MTLAMTRTGGCLAALLTTLGLGGSATADTFDLTTAGSSVTINGAIYQQTSPQPTGTGVIQPFLRLQNNGVEQGYNTSARPIESGYHSKVDPFTHDLLLSDIPVVNVNGTSYRQFLLDINESNGQNRELLSMDRLQIFQSNTGNISQYANLGTKIYDLDANTDNLVMLNYDLNHGSGSGDLFVYIPNALFDASKQYVNLYSLFGNTVGADGTSDAGFEEWATLKSDAPPPVNEVPAPATLVFAALGCGIGGVGYVVRSLRTRRKPQA